MIFNVDDILFGDFKEYRKTATVKAIQLELEFSVNTLEGVLTGKLGDYLCEGIDGERWPVKKKIFEKTYEVTE